MPRTRLMSLLCALLLAGPAAADGIWVSRAELAGLPTVGPAWDNLKRAADTPTPNPNLSDQDDPSNVRVLAKALVFARTGEARYRDEVVAACRRVIGTEQGGRILALGRELGAYVVAADLTGLPPADEATFRAFLRRALDLELEGKSLRTTHERRPNNWGTVAGGSRAAIAAYLGDRQELERTAQVFRAWLGAAGAPAAFEFKALDWQADPAHPHAINPPGAAKAGHDLDGALPEELRRADGWRWPPPRENYVYSALQGALVQAVILHRAGYDVWNWGDKALLRAFRWLHRQADFPAAGDDTWLPHLINHYYGSDFPAPVPSEPGKNMGWTDWTHGRS